MFVTRFEPHTLIDLYIFFLWVYLQNRNCPFWGPIKNSPPPHHPNTCIIVNIEHCCFIIKIKHNSNHMGLYFVFWHIKIKYQIMSLSVMSWGNVRLPFRDGEQGYGSRVVTVNTNISDSMTVRWWLPLDCLDKRPPGQGKLSGPGQPTAEPISGERIWSNICSFPLSGFQSLYHNCTTSA